MQKKLVLSLGVLSLLFACTPVADNGGGGNSTGGSSGSNSGGSSGSGGSSSNTGGNQATGSGGNGSGTGGSESGTGGSQSGTGGSQSGTGGSAGGTGGSPSGGTGGSSGDAAAPADMGGGTPGGGGPAAALHNLVVKVPCPNQTGMGASCTIGTDVRAYMKPVMIGGTAGTTYKVKLKICAVYEGRPYTGCMTSPDSPRICINGTPGTGGFAPTYPTLGLKVADNKTYWLNNGTDYADKILKFDYTGTFEIPGGTTINVISDGGSNGGVYTPYQGGAKHTCPDVPGFTNGTPFLGQFIHFQVVSVDPMN